MAKTVFFIYQNLKYINGLKPDEDIAPIHTVKRKILPKPKIIVFLLEEA
jgi:hypothetical protein